MNKFLKVGQLAKETGLSVRALHHYDQIGLLKPSDRSDSGYRIYNLADIKRLHKIIALRGIGLSLDEISNTLEEPIQDLQEKIDRQTEVLEQEIEDKQKQLKKMKKISQYIELKDNIEQSEVILLIRQIEKFEKIFSPEEQKTLDAFENSMQQQELKEAINYLPIFISGIRKCMDEGIPPTDSKVLDYINKWEELTKMVPKDLKDNISPKSTKMIEEDINFQELTGLDGPLLEYMKNAKKEKF